VPGRLLLASYSYPPIADVGSIRTIKLAKYLVRQGWSVHVISVRNPDVWRMIGPAEEPPGVEVSRTWDPIRLDRLGLAVRKVIVSRGDPVLQARAGLGRRGVVVPEFQAGWLLSAGRAMTRLARQWRATHLMGTGPPFSSLIASAVAQRHTGLPLLADFQDSWTIHPDTRYPTRIQGALDGDLERFVWERASAVTVVTPTIAERYRRKYPAWASKVQVLYNGFDPEDLPSAPPPREGAFRIVYTGSFYPHTPPSTLLAALASLKAAGKVTAERVQIDFFGRPEATVQAEIERLGLRDLIQIRGFRPLKEAVAAASGADLLYLLIPTHFAEALSDKMFTYLATGNPILAEVPEGECKAFLSEWAEHVFFVAPGDVNAMQTAIAEAIRIRPRGTSSSSKTMGFREAFSREAQAHQLVEILEAMA
jgi:glycosyltransferase involved in cell wall biosynthesis